MVTDLLSFWIGCEVNQILFCRKMYWTTKDRNYIVLRAGMDGTRLNNLVSGSGQSDGIQIDFSSRRLYWAETGNQRIRSSDLEGGDVMTTITAQLSNAPFGVSLVGDRLYWGYWNSNAFQSMTHRGTDVRNETVLTAHTWHFTVPMWDAPKTRVNHCEGRSCADVCVLTATSFTCLS